MTRNRIMAIAISVVAPVGILLAGVVTFVIMGALKPKPERNTAPLVGLSVFTAPIEHTGVALSAHAQGEVRPLRTAEISAQVAGPAVYVSPKLIDGGFINQGDVLVQIEDSDYRLGLAQTRSALARARRVMALADAEVAQARADWSELGDNKPSDLALRLPQRAEARADLDAASIAVTDAELRLQRTRVTAPFRGRVTAKMVEIGQHVAPGIPLASVFSTDAVEVELQVSGQNLADIGLSTAFDGSGADHGPEVILSAEVAGRTAKWTGTAVRVGASIDSATRMFSVYARLDDPFGEGADGDVSLVPGMFVDALIEGRRVDEARSAPRAALRGRDTLYVVESAEDGESRVMRMVRVNVVRTTPQRVYFLSELREGELVIISPVQAARDGMRVSVMAPRTGSDSDSAVVITGGG